MQSDRRRRLLVTAGVAGLLAIAPMLSACGGSSGGSASASVGATVGSASAGGAVSASVSAAPSVSASGLAVGKTATVTGTVGTIFADGHIFLLNSSTQSKPIPVASISPFKLKQGATVTVTGQVAQINLDQLVQEFNFTPPPQLSQLNGALVINAQNVTSGSASPAPSSSS